LLVFEGKNGNGSAHDNSLEMCAEMVVGHAVESAILWHTLETDMAAVLSRSHRMTEEPLSEPAHQFGHKRLPFLSH
jgi:hypothetical protein